MPQPQEDFAPDGIRLTNEFAEVVLRLAARGNGTRLHIQSLRRGTEVFIDPVVLEALTAVDPDVFTSILAATVPGNWEKNSLRYDG
ncbi:hypothetical protein [Mycobacterium asiaticum]|uniref:hypothetical protein n=1 Tax=Mycobacterium asiaticum TaxID=1790 RepID=UPI0009BE5612|nr:hypothetical protein [Mycobacterium asiaticum]